MFTREEFAFELRLGKRVRTRGEADKKTGLNSSIILQMLRSCRLRSKLLCGTWAALLNKLIGDPAIPALRFSFGLTSVGINFLQKQPPLFKGSVRACTQQMTYSDESR